MAVLYFYQAILIMAGFLRLSDQFVFERTDPIVWTPTQTTIISDMMQVEVHVRYVNPCSALNKIGLPDTTAVNEAIDECIALYDTGLLNTLRNFTNSFREPPMNHRRRFPVKRGLIGFISGLFLSNVLNTVLDHFTQSDHGPEFTPAVQARLQNLNEQINITTTLASAMTSAIEALRNEVQNARHQIEILNRVYPKLAMITSHISTQITRKADLWMSLKDSFLENKVDLKALSKILDSHMPYEFEESTAIPRSAALGATPGHMTVEFTANRRSHDTHLFKVESIRYWTNLSTTEPVLMEYGGPKMVVYNESSNCARGITSWTRQTMHLTCREQDAKYEYLYRWHPVAQAGDPWDQPMRTQVIEGWPFVVVYCFTETITVRGINYDCPPYPFRLNSTIGWNTTTWEYTPVFQSVDFNDNLIGTRALASTVHIPNSTEFQSESATIKKIHALNKELIDLQKQAMAIHIPIAGMSISHTSLSGLLFLALVLTLIALICLIIKLEINQRKRHSKAIELMNTNIAPLLSEKKTEALSSVRSESFKDYTDEGSESYANMQAFHSWRGNDRLRATKSLYPGLDVCAIGTMSHGV